MATIDDRTRELSCKVLFVGPPAAGVGTTFRELWALIPDAAESAVIPKPGEPPVYELRYRPRPAVRKQGLTVVLHLVGYEDAPAGGVFEEQLRGSDGLVLVCDSAPSAINPNRRAIEGVDGVLGMQGRSWEQLAVLLQYNKRDLPDALSIRQLEEQLNSRRWPYVATSAHRAQGLQEMLERLTALMSKWVRVPAQQVPHSAPAPTPRPAATPTAGTPTSSPRPAKPIAPTSSMVDAFARAEQKIFGRNQPAPGLADDVDEDRTVLAGGGGGPPPAQSPVVGDPGAGADQWADIPTQVGPERGFGGGPPQNPIGQPLRQDWSEDGPTQLDPGRAQAMMTSSTSSEEAPWNPAPQAAPPQPTAPQPLQAGPAPEPTPPAPQQAPPAPQQPSEDASVAPWEDDASVAPSVSQPPSQVSAEAPAQAAPPPAEPSLTTQVVHAQVPELTGHTVESVGVAQVRDMVTVSLPLVTSVGRSERTVDLRLEMGGTPPTSKAPEKPEGKAPARVGLPLFVICVSFLAILSAVLLVLYLTK